MSRKPKKGYFVRGQFVAAGSELDEALQRELRGGDGPTKTELKAQSAELQALGEAVLTLRSDLRSKLDLPDRLNDALDELARIRDFEGRRRQSQFVGKLMRQLDETAVQSIRDALEVQRQGASAEAAALHAAEHWRERLLHDDEAVTQWLADFPGTDSQQLRALVRQARKDQVPADAQAAARGQTPRQGRAYRELFQLVRAQLQTLRDGTGHSSEDDEI